MLSPVHEVVVVCTVLIFRMKVFLFLFYNKFSESASVIYVALLLFLEMLAWHKRSSFKMIRVFTQRAQASSTISCAVHA